MRRVTRLGGLVATGLLLAAGCEPSLSEDPDCDDGTCDAAGVLQAKPLPLCSAPADFETKDGSLACTPCGKALIDQSGRGFLPQFIANDVLVKKVYMSFEDKDKSGKIDATEVDCPLTMPDIMAKLGKFDNNPGGDCNAISTRVVSETAAQLGKDRANYRAVTTRTCGNRRIFGLLFSSFGFSGAADAKGTGVHISEAGHPGQIEIIAFDDTEGVFNYYKEVGGVMRFFGSSLDFTVAGPGGPGLTNIRGCANCHPGGGLVMKELQSPWTHWSLQDNIVGADELVNARRAYMGTLNSGADMQFSVTEAGNAVWNQTKAKFYSTVTTETLEAARSSLRDDNMSAAQRADIKRRQLDKGLNATQAMLEPLFCSVQVNINATGESGVPGQIFSVNRNGLSFPGFVASNAETFDSALAAIGSRVPGLPGVSELTTPFMVIERSAEDAGYVQALEILNVSTPDFTRDVLMVDFTRPVFSDDRCALLSFVPDLPPADRTMVKIRDALIESLQATGAKDGTPAAQLLGHLRSSKAGKAPGHVAALKKYEAACSARLPKDVVRDALKLRSLQRKLAYRADGALDDADGLGSHPFAVFEFEQTMPADDVKVTTTASPDSIDQVHPDARFSPIDCKLVSTFVPTPIP